MADTDTSLEVLIRSVFDATGYRMNEAEAQKLQQTVVKTNAVSMAANEEDAKTTDKLILSKKELKHVIGALGAEAVPELSRALATLAYGNGAVAGIFLLVGAFEMVRKSISEAKKADEDFNKEAATARFADTAEAIRAAVDAQGEYLAKLEEIKQGEHGLLVVLNNQLQLIAAIQAARQSQADAERTLALAKLKEDEVFGRVTESDAIQRRAQIEKKAIEDKAKSENETYRKQQQEREQIINEAAQKQNALDQARAEAKARLDAANLAKATSEKAPSLEVVRKAQDEAQKALEKFQAEWEIPMGVDSPLPEGTSERSRIDQNTAKQKQVTADLLQRQFYEAQRANRVDTKSLEADLENKTKEAKDNAAALAKARDDEQNASRTHSDPNVRSATDAARGASESAIDVQARAELAARARKLQDQFLANPDQLDSSELKELFSDLIQLGEAFFEQGKGAVTKQEFRQEMAQLRKLIDTLKSAQIKTSTTGQ
jgi:hypothetical protein